MERLLGALSEDPGSNIRAKEFLNEAIQWLQHIDTITSARDSSMSRDGGDFFLNDVTSNYCALLNWLTLINLIKPRVSNKEIGELIHQSFGWPLDVAEVFLNCVRNPTMHTGRAFIWGEYDSNWRHSNKKHGENLEFRGAFDPNISRVGAGPAPWHPNYDKFLSAVNEIGYIQGKTNWDDNSGISTTFFYLGFRSKIEELVLSTFTKLQSMTAEQSDAFEELNIAATLTRMAAPENGG